MVDAGDEWKARKKYHKRKKGMMRQMFRKEEQDNGRNMVLFEAVQGGGGRGVQRISREEE